MLNPDLDKASLALEFARDGRLRIENLLQPDIAEKMRNCCLSDLPYEFISFADGRNVVIPADEMQKFSPEKMYEFQQQVLGAAGHGVGFLYCGYMMSRALADSDNPNIRFLHSVFEYLNSEEMLSFISEITMRDDLLSADAQYTRYTPGQFLTRHRDDVSSQQRRLAYVISLSKNWHPDWGGLLQFFEDDGTPRDAWAPMFNSMSLFDIRHVHSVTYLAPYAREPRLSLTGWFRAIAE